MRRIEQKTYAVAQAVLAELSSVHLAVVAVLDGMIDGEIWVDDPVNPAVVIVVNGDTYFLAGNPDAAAPTLKSVKDIIPDWAYLFVEDRWVPHLSRIWNNSFAIPHPRIRMGYVSGTALPAPRLPSAQFELVPVDRALFDRNPDNLDVLNDNVEGWGSEDTFFESAVGFCVLHEGKIVSHSVTDSVSGSRCEVGVGTDAGFRRMGLGHAVVSATIAECIRRGHHAVEWHTHVSNKGSLAIGKAIGLVELDRHTAYSCSLPAENIGDLSSDDCLELAVHFEKAGEYINWSRFHAAGARALAGEREKALENVRLLIEGGWEGEAEWLEGFWALKTLTDDPAFQALLQLKRAGQTV